MLASQVFCFIKGTPESILINYFDTTVEPQPINPKDNHISFQVFFHDPDGYNRALIPIIPPASCSFKPRLSSFIKTAPANCGFMENAMTESLNKFTFFFQLLYAAIVFHRSYNGLSDFMKKLHCL
ncbi:hypothetical protein GQ457_05G012540 [Hibiscus cannabinus]